MNTYKVKKDFAGESLVNNESDIQKEKKKILRKAGTCPETSGQGSPSLSLLNFTLLRFLVQKKPLFRMALI
jgi:hypothetical protein